MGIIAIAYACPASCVIRPPTGKCICGIPHVEASKTQKNKRDQQHDMVLGKRIAWSIYLHTVIILPCLELLHNRGAVFRPHIL